MSPFAQLLDQAFQRRVAVEEARCATPVENALKFFEDGFDRFALRDSSGLCSSAAPAWAVELGVSLPCSMLELKRAFRRQVLLTHPDRPGGSHEAFLRTKLIFEQALEYLKNPPVQMPSSVERSAPARGYFNKPQVRSAQVVFAYG